MFKPPIEKIPKKPKQWEESNSKKSKRKKNHDKRRVF